MKVNNNEYVAICPCCNSKYLKSLGVINYPEDNFFSTTSVRLEKLSFLMKCGFCKSKFVRNRIPEKVAYNLYKNSSSNKRWSNEEPVGQTKNVEIIYTLMAFFSENKKVVDVGCNTGLLLDLAKKNGSKTIGIELSDESKKILLSKGHEVFESLDSINDSSVDVITAFDLVEHLYDVNGFIENCYTKLVKGGVLIILTGNPTCLSSKLTGSGWWYSSYPEHVVFPSKHYYNSLKGFKLFSYLNTYASQGYKVSKRQIFLFIIKSLLKSIINKFQYNGLPSLGPDHHLVVLKK
ncbi:MAG: class I SAM-dependent methyltransferase [Methyloprofundus sp.]|nr:class I SAM-dependent methyltransferase [Methyloprofundus sp.]